MADRSRPSPSQDATIPAHPGQATAGRTAIRPDEDVRHDVADRVEHHPDVPKGAVGVRVRDGVVVLEGRVPDDPTRGVLEEIAAAVGGVRRVSNRLAVASRNA